MTVCVVADGVSFLLQQFQEMRIALCIVAAAKEGGLKTVLVQFAEDEVKDAWLRSIVEGEVNDLLFRRNRFNLKFMYL